LLKTSELDYHLPEELIATTAAEPRDSARLMVVDRSDPKVLLHKRIRDLPALLHHGDLLVVNASKVLPARFEGRRAGTGGHLEGLYVRTVPGPERHWQVLLRGKNMRSGLVLEVGHLQLHLIEHAADEPGAWVVAVRGAAPTESDADILARIGQTPLPPYILSARKSRAVVVGDSYDRERYQTVYAGSHSSASIAAPTAGLHFTPGLLTRLAEAGVGRAEVVLQVGTGTFKPVETQFVEEHQMHTERCSMSQEVLEAIRSTRQSTPPGRVVCVGTTAARTVETYTARCERGNPPPFIDTRLLITPGYEWRWTDALLTNFHLPRSTLLAMVGAFLGDDGVQRLKQIYKTAIEERYRFYSYGDAMLIL
jgi:S-adenosylmethionine:tRNA ribosyltransferase-isomerase